MLPVEELTNVIELEVDTLAIEVVQGYDALEDEQVLLSTVPGFVPM